MKNLHSSCAGILQTDSVLQNNHSSASHSTSGPRQEWISDPDWRSNVWLQKLAHCHDLRPYIGFSTFCNVLQVSRSYQLDSWARWAQGWNHVHNPFLVFFHCNDLQGLWTNSTWVCLGVHRKDVCSKRNLNLKLLSIEIWQSWNLLVWEMFQKPSFCRNICKRLVFEWDKAIFSYAAQLG